jgi:hypothetical protein
MRLRSHLLYTEDCLIEQIEFVCEVLQKRNLVNRMCQTTLDLFLDVRQFE